MAHPILRSACLAAGLLLASCQSGGFGRSDVDRDGVLDYGEFSAGPVGRTSGDPGAAFIAADSDRDGALSSGEFDVYVSAHAGR